MAVRLPRIHWAAGVHKEHEWLPKLAPFLPLAIPIPLAKGNPGEGYPWQWSVYRWFEGENATIAPMIDLRQSATDLADFIVALRQIELTGGPPARRGVPLARRDEPTREAIEALRGTLDADAVTVAWDAALAAPLWQGFPVWIHGDLLLGNLLVQHGRIGAVIDFAGLGVADPACDLMIAWNLFTAEIRDVFREALAVDDATWARGCGWALSQALIFIPYYLDTNPVGVAIAQRTVNEILAEGSVSN